ncbi:ribonuclease P protein component [Telmatocola sphagniphila]|uniref:Ribonuclease P protein component n=1 Tax=Telmatocola sphagniphila TaxID=1123043 RepID=A0A8E6B695_9BACT|nr:ribonuclease P protein component [Telmatocola sphagniphila]QVL32064.1 ribonuclease P protein component [Telmatocola sphagniphila]
MSENRLSLGQHQRLKKTAEFDAVYNLKKSVSDAQLILFGKKNELPLSRIGLSVSKKHGNAVVRNRIKRMLREAFRTRQLQIPPGFDFVLVPRVGLELDLRLLQESIQKLTSRLARRISEQKETRPAENLP